MASRPCSVGLSRRHLEPEIMDDPRLDADLHVHALQGLSTINRFSGSARMLYRPIARLAAKVGGRPLRILDVATGGGDVPIRLGLWARRAGLSISIDACDRNPRALAHARARAMCSGIDISFFGWDALGGALPRGYDVITCSLFLHHLSDEEAVGFLRRLRESARRLVLVNDLRRSRAGWLLAWVGTRLLTRSPVVHEDGPMSVRAAFSLEAVARLAAEAGMTDAVTQRRWPFRLLLTWERA